MIRRTYTNRPFFIDGCAVIQISPEAVEIVKKCLQDNIINNIYFGEEKETVISLLEFFGSIVFE